MNMLDYQKMIIRKVSSSEKLFRKEIEKSFRWLEQEEIKYLKYWVLNNFYNDHPKTIHQLFEV